MYCTLVLHKAWQYNRSTGRGSLDGSGKISIVSHEIELQLMQRFIPASPIIKRYLHRERGFHIRSSLVTTAPCIGRTIAASII